MQLFPQLQSPSQQEPSGAGGLFAGLHAKLTDPAMKAGLLQAGMAMLNANPGQSPFAQIFSGIGQGIGAHEKYQDLVTQQEVDRQDALAAQARKDEEFALKQQPANARTAQVANAIQTSQANTASLGRLREAQTAKAGRSGADGSKAFSGAWRAFYRGKMTNSFGDTGAPTPEVLAQWKQEFNALESAGPGGGAAPVTSGAPSAAASGPESDLLSTAQQLAEDEGISLEEAIQVVKEAQSE